VPTGCGRLLLGWIFMQSGWRKLMDMPAFVKRRYSIDALLRRT
jgi:uncharacterized membrane protein YphA (DoxX/SURF4 family)